MATGDNYRILRKLGTGGFSDVFLAKHIDTQQTCALKVIVKNSDFNNDFEEFIKKEIDTMQQLNHKHIINLIDSSTNAVYKKRTGESYDVGYLALEVASNGDLFDYIAQTTPFSEDMARYYLHQIVDAFDYMNKKGITHRDMKPENLLLDKDYNLKISDFGWASNKSKNTTHAGTVQYMAPEIYLEENYTGSCVDIFATGAILFIMVAQHPPFGKPDPNDRHFNAICANREDLFWKWHTKNKKGGLDYFSESFRALIGQMLQLDPLSRPSLAEVKEHEWYNKPVPSLNQVITEFKERSDMINNTGMRQGEDGPEETPDPSVFKNTHKHRSVDTEDETIDVPCVSREPEIYDPEMKNCTHFFSNSNISTLFNVLAVGAHKMSQEYYFSEEEYSVVMHVVHEGKKVTLTGSILKIPDEVGSDENDPEEDQKMENGHQAINGNPEDAPKYCIDFHRYQGDNFLFVRLYNQILEYFSGHANALPPPGHT